MQRNRGVLCGFEDFAVFVLMVYRWIVNICETSAKRRGVYFTVPGVWVHGHLRRYIRTFHNIMIASLLTLSRYTLRQRNAFPSSTNYAFESLNEWMAFDWEFFAACGLLQTNVPTAWSYFSQSNFAAFGVCSGFTRWISLWL